MDEFEKREEAPEHIEIATCDAVRMEGLAGNIRGSNVRGVLAGDKD